MAPVRLALGLRYLLAMAYPLDRSAAVFDRARLLFLEVAPVVLNTVPDGSSGAGVGNMAGGRDGVEVDTVVPVLVGN